VGRWADKFRSNGPIDWKVPYSTANFGIDDKSRQVFGDDGLLRAEVTDRMIPTREDEIEAVTCLNAIVSCVLRNCGFGVSSSDVFFSTEHSEFLNWHVYGMLNRRSRVVLEREKGEGGDAASMSVASMGAIVSGESAEGYSFRLIRVLVSSREKAVYGAKSLISIGTFLKPDPKKLFCTGLPFPTAAYPNYLVDKSLLPGKLKVTVMDEFEEENITKELGEQLMKIFTKVRIKIGGINEPVKKLEDVIKDSKSRLISSKRVYKNVEATKDERERFGYEFGPDRAAPEEIGKAAMKDEYIKRKVMSHNKVYLRDEEVEMERRVSFDVGFASKFFLGEEAYGKFVSMGRGKFVFMEFVGDREREVTRFSYVFPIVACFSIGLFMQSVFGLTSNPTPALKEEFSTGDFSVNKIQSSSIINIIREKDKDLGPAEVERVMKIAGFSETEIDRKKKMLEFVDFSLESEQLSKWKSRQIAELPFSYEVIAESVAPLIEYALQGLHDRDLRFTKQMRQVAEGVISSIVINSAMVSIYEWNDNFIKLHKRAPELLDFWNAEGIELGRVYPITFTNRY